MNRIPITLLTGAPREAEEMKRRMRRILDKPISLGVHYSASESPAEPTDSPVFADELDVRPTPIGRLTADGRKTFWQLVGLIVGTLAASGLIALIFG